MIGKTITRVDEVGDEDGSLVLHFTDGTGAIVGHGWDALTFAELVSRDREAQGDREADRLTDLIRDEWLSISCDERAARRGAPNPLSFILPMFMEEGLLRCFGAREITRPCEACGERKCPNAKREALSELQGVRTNTGYITISTSLPDRMQDGSV